jgi:hypothetical protein
MRIRTPVVLLLVAGAGYWIYKTRPTVSGFVDDLTSPLMRSKAAVKESEYKRIVAEAAPVPEGEEVPLAALALKEGMKTAEVKELLGTPERVEWFREKGRERLRWTYVRAKRVLVFEDGRVVSIAIR